jgi:peptidyl-tRNA hydrolase
MTVSPNRPFAISRRTSKSYLTPMPALENPFDANDLVAARSSQDDPLVMYYVVNKTVRLSVADAMVLGGFLAVQCHRQFADSEQWSSLYQKWNEQSYRKVALRASADEVAQLKEEVACVADAGEANIALCLPPMYKSMCGPLLSSLKPLTDTKKPVAESVSDSPYQVTYVVREGVMKSAGKAMAQAGHGAVMAFSMPGHLSDMQEWHNRGGHAFCRVATEEQWDAIKRDTDCVVVRDAGLTQVAPNTETVLVVMPSFTDILTHLPAL